MTVFHYLFNIYIGNLMTIFFLPILRFFYYNSIFYLYLTLFNQVQIFLKN